MYLTGEQIPVLADFAGTNDCTVTQMDDDNTVAVTRTNDNSTITIDVHGVVVFDTLPPAE